MAEENNLEGFDDLDILGEGEEGGEGGSEFSGELDDLLGGDEPGGGAGGGGEEGGESELDSFFEDLSTIDDLEVMQDDEGGEDLDVGVGEAGEEEDIAAMPEPQPAPRQEAPRRQAQQPARERKPRRGLRRFILWLIILGILGGGGYYAYRFLFPVMELPWPVFKEEPRPQRQPEPVVMQPQPEPAPPPQREPAPPPEPEPEPEPEPPPQPTVFYGVQVATCFFSSCVDNYRAFMRQQGHDVTVREAAAETEALEVYTEATFTDLNEVQELAERINREHRLEGHAYVFQDGAGYHISMGAFADLSRANEVRDALNQQFGEELNFTARVKGFTYQLKRVVAGNFPSRAAAQRAAESLRQQQRTSGAFVVRK